MTAHDTKVQHARNVLRQAKRVMVLTGAGISAESGVPTFRDAAGHWKNIPPEKVATPEAFARDPKFVWEWYDSRRVHLLGVKPNKGHECLANLEQHVEDFFLLTQNVEDLHEQAGSKRVAHIHGNIWEVQCTKEGIVREDRRAPLPELPPRCPRCGALERPNVVWFGETICEDAVHQTEQFLSEGEADAVMVIGTGAMFIYISEWANRARGASGVIIEINPDETSLYEVDISLKGKAGEILPKLIEDTLP